MVCCLFYFLPNSHLALLRQEVLSVMAAQLEGPGQPTFGLDVLGAAGAS